ncbi:carboxypeptidase-like regulatory domain-containing protein [Solitalea canadensis]|uniref:carboxypeptidase-like regulatory domain-containing protein n=1 Tax=Solitalea canadensis TaxID=995 RepID=UPI0009DB168B
MATKRKDLRLKINSSSIKPITFYSGLKVFFSSLLLSLGLINNAKGATSWSEKIKITSYNTQEISINISDSIKVITGRVLYKQDNESVQGAVISIKGTDVKTYSDKDGNFRLEIPTRLINKKKITLTVNFLGFQETIKKLKSNELNNPLFIELKLDATV